MNNCKTGLLFYCEINLSQNLSKVNLRITEYFGSKLDSGLYYINANIPPLHCGRFILRNVMFHYILMGFTVASSSGK